MLQTIDFFSKGVLNSLPNKKMLDCSKSTAFVDENINRTEKKKKIVLRSVENIVRKGENAGFSYNFFKKVTFSKLLKVWNVLERVKHYPVWDVRICIHFE